MIDFKLALIFGSKLEEIRHGIENFESIHLGLFINSLRYKNEKEGKKVKDEFIKSSTNSIKLINREISKFNIFIHYFNTLRFVLPKVIKIDQAAIRSIILKHQGHYPQAEGIASFIKESLGDGDSPSILARRHTALQISNVIQRTKISLSELIKDLNRFTEVFDTIQRKKLRLSTKKEIEISRSIYSFGLFSESIFVLGRLLENLVTEYILLLKKENRISLKKTDITNHQFDFHKKLEFLHSKKLSILSDSQFSKLMSIKWDRNLYGHKINIRTKDHQAMVAIGLQEIDFFDNIIVKLKQKSKK